jgi:hypothetical protein
MAAPQGRVHSGPGDPVAGVTEDPARAPGAASLAELAAGLQRTAGNRATGSVLRQAVLARETTPERAALDEAVAKGDVAGILGTSDYGGLVNAQRVSAIEAVVAKPELGDADKQAIARLWEGMTDYRGQLYLQSELWFRCVDKGVKLARWTAADAADLASAVGPKVITQHQARRVPDAVEGLSRQDYRALRLNLWLAITATQRAYIVKALAAGRTMDAIEKFATTIRYETSEWMASHLMVVDEEPVSQTGPGIRQQWQMSCGPTSVQTLHAQTDPIYALELTGGGDVKDLGKNAASKTEQGNILKGHGSVPSELGVAGGGAWVEDDLNALKAETGLTYVWTPVKAVDPTNKIGSEVDLALEKIKGWLGQGIYVPIVIGGKPEATSHYNVILRYDSHKGFLVHDPGKGYSAWVNTTMFLDNKLAPPLSWTYLAGYDTPTQTKK